jgi:hypothetical protein
LKPFWGNAVEINALYVYDQTHQVGVRNAPCLRIFACLSKNGKDCRLDPPKPVGAEIIQCVQVGVAEYFFVVCLGLVIAISAWQVAARIFYSYISTFA